VKTQESKNKRLKGEGLIDRCYSEKFLLTKTRQATIVEYCRAPYSIGFLSTECRLFQQAKAHSFLFSEIHCLFFFFRYPLDTG
jgi:hypothetical protein